MLPWPPPPPERRRSALYKLPKGELMLADAPEMIERFLASEQDASAKRNAFQMLTAHAQVGSSGAG